MKRRRLLAALGGVSAVFAGCLSGSSRAPTDATPDSDPNATTRINGVAVPPCPDRPDSFTAESALAFATQFEQSHVTRTTLRGRDDVISMFVSTHEERATVDETDAGWRVTFETVGPGYKIRTEDDETRHADPPLYVASYLLTEKAVYRATDIEARDPQADGAVVRCPPE